MRKTTTRTKGKEMTIREQNRDENKTGEQDNRNTQTSQLWGPKERVEQKDSSGSQTET